MQLWGDSMMLPLLLMAAAPLAITLYEYDRPIRSFADMDTLAGGIFVAAHRRELLVFIGDRKIAAAERIAVATRLVSNPLCPLDELLTVESATNDLTEQERKMLSMAMRPQCIGRYAHDIEFNCDSEPEKGVKHPLVFTRDIRLGRYTCEQASKVSTLMGQVGVRRLVHLVAAGCAIAMIDN